jgi:hypothetical protein
LIPFVFNKLYGMMKLHLGGGATYGVTC